MSAGAARDDSSRNGNERGDNEPSNSSPTNGNGFSIASTETGESSKRSSFTVDETFPLVSGGHDLQNAAVFNGPPLKTAQDGRESHRSHRSRGSASFLVSNSIFEPLVDARDGARSSFEKPARQRDNPRDHKEKVILRTPEKKHKKKRSSFGLGVGGSPLAATVTNALIGPEAKTGQIEVDGAQDSSVVQGASRSNAHPAAAGIDVESAQIVNLALNLSESRRQASRRNVTTPVPPTITGFGEGFAGGSLRQHLQAQRRSSRTVSPKPERGDRIFSGAPRLASAQRIESPLQTAIGHPDGDYQYHFSASTLARAEKARNAIELMAQYRRLLQCLPPLKPQIMSRATTRSPPNTAIGSPTHWAMPPSLEGSDYRRLLGRPYNPLQYIRNRKVRARERKTIDGELQGFGDVEKVAIWVDRVAKTSAGEGFQSSDYVELPGFVIAHETKVTPSTSPPSALARGQPNASKVKRPRVDWIINPADMLADAYWLEQDDNKKLIEDNRERKIFHQSVELTRPVSSHKGDGSAVLPDIKQDEFDKRLRLDTKLPVFSPLRSGSDRHSESSRGRGQHAVTQLHEDIGKKGYEHHTLKSHHRSSSESSKSDPGQRRSKHRRNATIGSEDISSDILEKQMLEILAKETNDNLWDAGRDAEGEKRPQSNQLPIIALREKNGSTAFEMRTNDVASSTTVRKDAHRRKESRSSQHVPGRASLEVPESRGRSSLDGLDSSAPSSPQVRASNALPLFMPSIAIDLSPPTSRRTSPTRQPTLAKVKSKISSFHDRSRNHSRSGSIRLGSGDAERENTKSAGNLDIPSPDGLRRTPSPDSKVWNRKADDGVKTPTSKAGSIRRRAEDLPSGIKGLFKSGRSRVNNLIWNKEMSPGSVASSNTSSDNSDIEDENGMFAASRTTTIDRDLKHRSREGSTGRYSLNEPKHYDLPVFRSPWEQRGRSGAPAEEVESPESDYVSHRRRAREQRRISRQQFLNPPRIDVQGASPSSSPDLRATNPSSRNSDVSDLENRRSNSIAVQNADARLNSILGIPGHIGRLGPPVTGLAHALNSRRANTQNSDSKRQWSISDRTVAANGGPMTKREISRIRALLLSSGIKARELNRLANEVKDIRVPDRRCDYTDIAPLDRDPPLLKPVPRYQTHVLAAQIVSRDIQMSSQIWQETVSIFSNTTVSGFLDRVEDLQDRIIGRNGLSEMTRMAEREADDVSKDLVTSKTLAVKELLERMGTILRRRRRRFRWVRRAGWVLLEWVLVGIMWWAWLIVIVFRFSRATVRGATAAVRWLLWL